MSEMEPIRSPSNRGVVEAGRLHRARERRLQGSTLLEGPNLLAEALAAGIVPQRCFALADDTRLAEWPAVSIVTETVMSRLAGTENPRGPVAVIAIPTYQPPPSDVDALVLWQVGDPGNVGTAIRSCAAFGLAVGIGPATADPWSPKVLRAGAGAHFRLPMFAVDGPDDLDGWKVAAAVARGGISPAGLEGGPWAVLIGSEPHGLETAALESASALVTIPMPGGVESLNAAVAGSIVAYELGLRRRNGSGGGSGRH